jgi:rhodanese-related sulfurtransferase
MTHELVQLIAEYGVLLVFLNVLIEQIGLPVPAIPTLEAFDLHVGNLPRDRDIVLYCTCPNEASAAQVAKLLMDRGYRRVRPLQGGLDAWVAAGYRIESLKALA